MIIRLRRMLALIYACAAIIPAAGAEEWEGARGDWPADVEGWVPVKPGEHPRLLFRKSDLPELKRRAETPIGKIIMKRLNEQLTRTPFTTWHSAGYAFLYQITGKQEHADKAKSLMQATLNGRGNPDGRYTYPGNGQLRAGPVLAGVALAYDLAYDGWDEEFRRTFVQKIMSQNYFNEIPTSPRHGPGCNHYGAHQGGAGVALLALRGDPGVDNKKIEDYLAKVVHNAKREIDQGYGLRGYYYEGHHCGRLSSNTGLIPFIQCYRVAAGKDLVKNSVNAQWLAAKWVPELILQPDGSYADLERGMYCRNFQRGQQLSSDGDFCQGFGIVPEKYKRALLWTFNNVVQPKENKDYDVVEYPHHGIYALVNWPIGVKEQNPIEVMPRVFRDPGPNYFIFRTGWTRGDDIITTAIMGSRPGSGRGMGAGGSVTVAGRGLKYTFPGCFHSTRCTYVRFAEDGSGIVSGILHDQHDKRRGPLANAPKTATSLAVDYGKASGADLLVAMVGPQVGFSVAYWIYVETARVGDAKAAAGGYFTKTTAVDFKPDAVRKAEEEAAEAKRRAELAEKGVTVPADLAAADDGEEKDDDDALFEKSMEPDMAELKRLAKIRAERAAAADPNAPPPPRKPEIYTGYVMTLQKGEAPKVTVKDGVVTVGDQVIKFDGKKLILSKIGPEIQPL